MDVKVLALAKKYTDESVEGAGAIKGKNCTISSIDDITGGHRVTFAWELDDGTPKTETLDVMDGADGTDGIDGAPGRGVQSVSIDGQNHLIITYTDGSTSDAGLLPVGQNGNNISY